MLRFLAFGSKIDQDSSWYIHQDESWSILLPNARKRSTGAPHRARNAGKRSTGAVSRAKIEFLKKYFVSTEGHSKLQKMAFEKISSIFSVLFLDDAFSTKRAVTGGNLARMEFRTRKTAKPMLARSSAISGHKTEFLTKNNVDFPR